MEGIRLIGPNTLRHITTDQTRQPLAAYTTPRPKPTIETRANTGQTTCPSCGRNGFDARASYCDLCGYAGNNGATMGGGTQATTMLHQRANHTVHQRNTTRCGMCGSTAFPQCCLWGWQAQ